MKKIPMIGRKFGRLAVVSQDQNESKILKWICLCDCGNTIVAFGTNLRRGHTTSCGCFQKEVTAKANTKHGMHSSREYMIWAGMMARCKCETRPDMHRYSGRGISVCKEWQSFARFYADMGDAPSGYTLDRIDNDGNYELGNCRWASKKTQANNRSTNRIVDFNGERKTIAECMDDACVKPSTFRQRYYVYGWSFEKSLMTPLMRKRR